METSSNTSQSTGESMIGGLQFDFKSSAVQTGALVIKEGSIVW